MKIKEQPNESSKTVLTELAAMRADLTTRGFKVVDCFYRGGATYEVWGGQLPPKPSDEIEILVSYSLFGHLVLVRRLKGV